jgi:hypothetical protein
VKNRLVAFGIDTSYCCLFTLWFVDNNRSSASEKSVLDMSLYSSTMNSICQTQASCMKLRILHPTFSKEEEISSYL